MFYEGPKNCIYGYLVRKDDKTRTIVDWVILSGKEYCYNIKTLLLGEAIFLDD